MIYWAEANLWKFQLVSIFRRATHENSQNAFSLYGKSNVENVIQ